MCRQVLNASYKFLKHFGGNFKTFSGIFLKKLVCWKNNELFKKVFMKLKRNFVEKFQEIGRKLRKHF